MTQALTTWDFTLWKPELTPKEIGALLRTLALKWVFQKEESKDKGLHFQGRLRLRSKKRACEIQKLIKETIFEGAHFSPTSNPGTRNFDYVMKLDSRVEGPWTDQDTSIQNKPRQLKRIKEMKPWQQSVIDMIKKDDGAEDFNDREIHVIYSEKGSVGGNILKQHLFWHKLAMPVPPLQDMEKLIGFVCSFPPAKAYYIDIPRACDPKKMYGLWAAIEQVKDGYIYDWRNKGQQTLFDTPFVIVKTNVLPPESFLSKDRWTIWTIEEGALEKWDGVPPEPAQRSSPKKRKTK